MILFESYRKVTEHTGKIRGAKAANVALMAGFSGRVVEIFGLFRHKDRNKKP